MIYKDLLLTEDLFLPWLKSGAFNSASTSASDKDLGSGLLAAAYRCGVSGQQRSAFPAANSDRSHALRREIVRLNGVCSFAPHARPGGRGSTPEAAPIEEQGLGWINPHKTRGIGRDTVTSGIEGAWTTNPTKWDNGYFAMLLNHEWELKRVLPALGNMNLSTLKKKINPVDVEDSSIRHMPIMTDADMAMKVDPSVAKISERFAKDQAYY